MVFLLAWHIYLYFSLLHFTQHCLLFWGKVFSMYMYEERQGVEKGYNKDIIAYKIVFTGNCVLPIVVVFYPG